MMNTNSYEMHQPVENLAIGYSRADNKLGWENNLYKHVIKGGLPEEVSQQLGIYISFRWPWLMKN